jgi:arylamine N-acetyltransferase
MVFGIFCFLAVLLDFAVVAHCGQKESNCAPECQHDRILTPRRSEEDWIAATGFGTIPLCLEPAPFSPSDAR